MDSEESEEESNCPKEFYYLFTFVSSREEDYGLPPGEMQDIHHFKYDKKGLITCDDLEEKMGTMSQTYVYEYQDEFY